MSTIDKIMWAIGHHGDDCIRSDDAASESFEALRELITAALAEARREGAEQMRIDAGMLCTAQADEADGDIAYRDACHDCAKAVRALPMPTGPRQAVRLTDEQIGFIAHEVAQKFLGGAGNDTENWDTELSRAIETAVLAENGMGTK
jgi:hypothetical protein